MNNNKKVQIIIKIMVQMNFNIIELFLLLHHKILKLQNIYKYVFLLYKLLNTIN